MSNDSYRVHLHSFFSCSLYHTHHSKIFALLHLKTMPSRGLPNLYWRNFMLDVEFYAAGNSPKRVWANNAYRIKVK